MHNSKVIKGLLMTVAVVSQLLPLITTMKESLVTVEAEIHMWLIMTKYERGKVKR